MKRATSSFIVLFFILSGISSASLQINTTHTYNSDYSESVVFPDSLFNIAEGKNEYVRLSTNYDVQYILNPGQPMMPRVIKKYELPFGCRSVYIKVKPELVEERILLSEIEPSPSPVALSSLVTNQDFPKKVENIYSSSDFFPSSWYSYNVGCGLNKNLEHITHVTLNIYPVRYSPASNKIKIINEATVVLSYEKPLNNPFPEESIYDMVIIAPSKFSDELQPLINHKNEHNVNTTLKTTEDIYKEYEGRDKPEQIKYFIRDAIETWNIKYVLLIGGLKSKIYGKPKDNINHGSRDWYIPVRYSNLYETDPAGFPSDLYYADIYKESGDFENWDSNENGIMAEWTNSNQEPEDILDLYPDVALGRLACRNKKEVEDVINKIITYETSTYNTDWFKRMIVISGDGFLDQQDLNISWDTKNLPNGRYTIHAQSFNPEEEYGSIDKINITLDRAMETHLSFNHDDHLSPSLANGYPAPPIAEIVSVSEGNILGYNDYNYTPNENQAYCNDFMYWANISYNNGILIIRGKSYDPKPYGNLTNINVWIKNDSNITVFSAWRNNTETYYEGEWVTGEKKLHGRGGALYYMPHNFDKEILWTSNGNFTGQDDVISALSKGHGFVFFSGHASPATWGDQTPGIPGNRRHGSVTGLEVSELDPLRFPMSEIDNIDKLPILVVGGCHSSLFNVSLIPSILQIYLLRYFGYNNFMWTYGQPAPECWSWYLVKMPKTGAIATIGNTAIGWGWEGEYCTIGAGDGWISSEFFRQYGEYGHDILGETHLQTVTSYIDNFKYFVLPDCWWYPDLGWDWIDQQSVEEWVLLGDPSLKIGGYS